VSTWRILHGDVREQLATLGAGSVQCVVTSPPYWGLRDYGTASWAGGDPDCDHLGPPMRTNNKPTDAAATFHGGQTRANEFFRDICGKCGAQRIDSQIGLEPTPAAYVQQMVGLFREVRRVLKEDGTLWLNLGDSYAGSGKGPSNNSTLDRPYRGMSNIAAAPNRWLSVPDGIKQKDLVGIPWRVAFALQADGWYLRSDIIWSKPNPMPESVTDRPTKAHEYIFLLSKSAKYYYDAEAIKEASVYPDDNRKARASANDYRDRAVNDRISAINPMNAQAYAERNKRSVWHVATQPYEGAHFATYPEKLIEPCILAGSRIGDTVLDPFCGSGTTGAVAIRHQRNFIGIELNASYVQLARKRIGGVAPLFADEASA